MELEDRLRSEYQAQLDAKSDIIEQGKKALEEQKAVIAKQLEQITEMSSQRSASKNLEQQNRELNNRADNLTEKVATQKQQLKALQKDLAEERAEIKSLKQFDPIKMKKNLDSGKKKLAEKTAANDLLQKSLSKVKNEKAELEVKVKELEAQLAELQPSEDLEEAAA
jgi:chromosome segregation ATPase